MKIYDESGSLLVGEPDLTKGWLESQQRVAVHHPAQPEQPEVSHIEVMPGTDGLRCVVVDRPAVPARPAWDEYETVQVYHPYTPEQLEAMNRPTLEQRLEAAENALLELMLRSGPAAQGGAENV